MADDSLTLLRKKIDYLLCERRPDRYDVRHHDDDAAEVDAIDSSWLDEIADEIADEIPTSQILSLARNLVRQREGAATRSANSLIRKYEKDGQLPLDWWGYERFPVAVVTRTQREGKDPEVKEERVALGAMTPTDFIAFATEERVRAARDFASRNATCDAAEDIARSMIKAKCRTFTDWAETVSPRDEQP